MIRPISGPPPIQPPQETGPSKEPSPDNRCIETNISITRCNQSILNHLNRCDSADDFKKGCKKPLQQLQSLRNDLELGSPLLAKIDHLIHTVENYSWGKMDTVANAITDLCQGM